MFLNAQRMKMSICCLVLLFLPLVGIAYSETLMLFTGVKSKLITGDLFHADVAVKDTPLFYGADINIKFDPNVLEAADADEQTPGVQIKPGELLDPDQSFILHNRADNKNGHISYAVSLLNPAPSVNGSGVLASIAFRAKSPGLTDIHIEKGQLGTREGKTLFPKLKSIQITVTNETVPVSRNKRVFAGMLIFAGLLVTSVLIRYAIRNLTCRRMEVIR